jgi:hypothetical protein
MTRLHQKSGESARSASGVSAEAVPKPTWTRKVYICSERRALPRGRVRRMANASGVLTCWRVLACAHAWGACAVRRAESTDAARVVAPRQAQRGGAYLGGGHDK